MILNGPGKISIIVGGQVVGMAKEAKFSIAEDEASTKEFSDPWRTPDIKQSWDISCDAMVRDAGDVLRDLLNGKEKWDVTIGQEVGKLPRKMKKALHSKRMSKWKRKAASYINRRQVRIHDAEMVVTPDQFGTLMRCNYHNGSIDAKSIADKNFEKAMNLTIDNIHAGGGWGAMDYAIYCKKKED